MEQPLTPARPLPVEDVPHWDIQTDIAIVGFGAAGSCAAIEARSAGAEVAVCCGPIYVEAISKLKFAKNAFKIGIW